MKLAGQPYEAAGLFFGCPILSNTAYNKGQVLLNPKPPLFVRNRA